jgi:colanic acid/amylovoran biosynthesis protein
MKILIIGGQFHNKGAYLMVMTVIKKLKELISNSEIVMSNYLTLPENLQDENIKLLKLPLLHVGYEHKQLKKYLKYGPLVNLYKGFPKGEIALKDIDVIVDIAGFAYGDLWGTNPLINLNYLLYEVMGNNVKYIVLPQAFGPFEKPGMGEQVKKMIARANLIFARDRISKSYLTDLALDNVDKIQQAPDITLNFKDEVKEVDLPNEDAYCCIVPNERMLDKGDSTWQGTYADILEKIIKQIESSDLKVLLMVHDSTSGDAKIAKALHERINAPYCKLIEIADPIEIKKVIANSKFLVGSRFHSLASALSSNVPSLAMGWSHKYQMLFEEYGQDDYVFDMPETTAILTKVAQLQSDDANIKIRNKLIGMNERIVEKNRQMWQVIGEELKKKTF